jgi:ABC-type lipoprotein export system ATPase subunit
MDEPTGNLDTVNAEIITDLLLELVEQEEVSLIVATHDLSLAGRLDETLNLELS